LLCYIQAKVIFIGFVLNDNNTSDTAKMDYLYKMISQNTRHIVFLIIPEATLLDITGAYEVFSQAMEYMNENRLTTGFNYKLHYVSIGKSKNISTSSGMVIHCSENIKAIDYPVDTLVIPGVPNSKVEEYHLPSNVLEWIKMQSEKARRTCAVCTGSFFLAEAGVLKGKKATTHWEKYNLLAKKYPDIQVDGNSIFIKDGNIYTSAGISSGMDLALALVEEDCGKSLALEVAKQMVLYLKRPGSQSQYSHVLNFQKTDYQPIVAICDWISEHIQEPMSVEILAEQVSMSARNFARVFMRETGITPAKYIDKLRVETACRYLTDTALSLKEVSILSGLGSPDNMRKVFLKNIRISPMDYRRNFNTAFINN